MATGPLPLTIDAGGGRTRTIIAQRDWSIAALYRSVSCTLTTTSDINAFYLIHAGSELDVNKNISDYEFKEHDKLTFVQRNAGGADSVNNEVPGGFRRVPGLQFTSNPCCVLFDDNPSELRALLPCHCAISNEGVKMMINTTLRDGEWSFHCPGCGHKLDFVGIRQLLTAVLTDQQVQMVKKRLDDNYLRQPLNDIRQCGTCGTYSQRDFSKQWLENLLHCAVCYTCTRRKGRSFQFCWHCGQEWKGGDGRVCGNAQCDGPASSLKILASCKTKNIDLALDVPDTRACPQCGALISHSSDCKHMDCAMCGCSFCFVCLKVRLENGNWQCGEYYEPCLVAPRQTTVAEFIRR